MNDGYVRTTEELIAWAAAQGADDASLGALSRMLAEPSAEDRLAAERDEQVALLALIVVLRGFDNVPPPVFVPDDPLGLHKMVAWGWAATVRRLVNAAVLLISEGFAAEGVPLSRSAFEHTVYLIALADDPAGVFTRLHADEMKRADRRRRLDEDEDDDDIPTPFLEDLLRSLSSGASGSRVTVSQMIRDVGFAGGGDYLYGLMSQVVHPTIYGATRYHVRPGHLPAPGPEPYLEPWMTPAEIHMMAINVEKVAAILDQLFPGLGAVDALASRNDILDEIKREAARHSP
jgi:hypothetical protein